MKYRVKGTNVTIARYDYDEHNVNIILVSPRHLLIRNYEDLTSKQRAYYQLMGYRGCKVAFSLDDLEPYEEVLISHNTKVGIVYVLSIILIISAFMWAMDLCYNVVSSTMRIGIMMKTLMSYTIILAFDILVFYLLRGGLVVFQYLNRKWKGKLNEQYTMYAITKLITLFDQLFSIETIMLFIFIALGTIETLLNGF